MSVAAGGGDESHLVVHDSGLEQICCLCDVHLTCESHFDPEIHLSPLHSHVPTEID